MNRIQVRAKHLKELEAKVRAARRGGDYVPDDGADANVLEKIGVPVSRVDVDPFIFPSPEDDSESHGVATRDLGGDLHRPEQAKDEDLCTIDFDDIYVPAAAIEIRTLLSAVDDDEPSSWIGWQQALIRMHCQLEPPTPELLARLTALREAAATRPDSAAKRSRTRKSKTR